MGIPPPNHPPPPLLLSLLPHTHIHTLTLIIYIKRKHLNAKQRHRGHSNAGEKKAIHDAECWITSPHVLFSFINIYICLHLPELITIKIPKTESQKHRCRYRVVWEKAFSRSHQKKKKKNYKARYLCAICCLCDSANVRANSSFIEMISNGWNPY